MKLPLQITLTERVVEFPPLFGPEPGANPDTATDRIKVLDVHCTPNDFSGKEAQEIGSFIDFIKTEEFWQSVESLRPGTPRTNTLVLIKNSDGDDPPDLVLLIPSGTPIGIELTDCSPIAACVTKVMASSPGPSGVPGASDAGSMREVNAFMAHPQSLVKPYFTDLGAEGQKLVSYLEHQISAKDVPGNELLLLTGSFMGGWPDSEFAAIARNQVAPKHIKVVVVVSQSRSTII